MNYLPSEKYSGSNCAIGPRRDFPNPDFGVPGVMAVKLFQALETGNAGFSKHWKS